MDRRTDRGGEVVLDHQPARPCLVSCGGDRKRRIRLVVLALPGRSSHCPSPRARPPRASHSHSTGRAVHAARNARDDAREWLLAFETTSSLVVARHCSPNNSSAKISCRMCRVEMHTSFPSRGAPHFALRTAVLGARRRAPPLYTAHPMHRPHTHEIRFLRRALCVSSA